MRRSEQDLDHYGEWLDERVYHGTDWYAMTGVAAFVAPERSVTAAQSGYERE
jgi:hypothetical protein